MKRLLTVSVLLALGALASFGATTPPACSTQTASTIGSYTCEIGDKVFSNFSETGITSGTVDFSFSGTQYFVHFATSTPLTTGFSLGFWVAVDTTVCPTCQIIQVQDQMQTANTTPGQPAIPNSSTASVTHNPGSPATVNLDALNAFDQSGVSNMGTTLEKVMFTYSPGANGELSVAQFTISQTTTPEPVTLSLTGLGLLGLGILGRRRLKQ
jgi:hypothetical protein